MRKYIIIAVFTIPIIIGLVTFIKDMRTSSVIKNKFYKLYFNGKVEKMTFSHDGFPTIYIDNKGYYLGIRGGNIDDYLEIGDSIIKDSNTFDLIILKRHDGQFERIVY